MVKPTRDSNDGPEAKKAKVDLNETTMVKKVQWVDEDHISLSNNVHFILLTKDIYYLLCGKKNYFLETEAGGTQLKMLR